MQRRVDVHRHAIDGGDDHVAQAALGRGRARNAGGNALDGVAQRVAIDDQLRRDFGPTQRRGDLVRQVLGQIAAAAEQVCLVDRTQQVGLSVDLRRLQRPLFAVVDDAHRRQREVVEFAVQLAKGLGARHAADGHAAHRHAGKDATRMPEAPEGGHGDDGKER